SASAPECKGVIGGPGEEKNSVKFKRCGLIRHNVLAAFILLNIYPPNNLSWKLCLILNESVFNMLLHGKLIDKIINEWSYMGRKNLTHCTINDYLKV
ncbi:hypothetical protein, partial [Lascolabacillus sp.]|uniref:hypothetical protein n=1 Tax=Lascolabacillus sp. TaxID=1924068 RepID=UPI002582BEF2